MYDAVYACPAQAARPPATPAALQALTVDPTHVQLTWSEAAETVDTYGVYESNGQSSSITGGLTRYTLGGLTPNTDYCFTPYAANATGASGWSDRVCVHTPATAG